MNAFGMDSNNGTNDFEIRNSLKKELLDRATIQSKSVACRGRAVGNSVDGGKYKLYIEDSKYCIERSIDAWGIDRADLADLQKWADEKRIELDQSSYTCTLLDDQLECSSKPNVAGEVFIRVNDIGIQFTSKAGENYYFYVENTLDNTKLSHPLLKELGIKNYYNVIDVPEDTLPVKTDRGNSFLADTSMYLMFRQKGRLFFLRPELIDNEYVEIAEIRIDEILFYKQEGSLHYEQSVSGSGGTSNSYGGAIVGGLLFGAAGAIIGSRKNETPVNISSTTIKHDTRVVVLSVKRNGKLYNISFPVETEGAFDWIIPDKQYDYVVSKRREIFEQEIKQLGDKNETMGRLFQVKSPALSCDSDAVSGKYRNTIPIPVDSYTIKCPICGREQNSNRTKCQKCGVIFYS